MRLAMDIVDKETFAALEDHLKQWQQMSEQMKAQLNAQMITAQKAVDVAIEAISLSNFEPLKIAISKFAVPDFSAQVIPAQKALEAAVEAISISNFEPPKIAVSKFAIPDLSFLATQGLNVQAAIQCLVIPVFDRLNDSLRNLPSQAQEAILCLAEGGWYLDLDMTLPQMWELGQALLRGEVTEAEDALIDYFEKRLDGIESLLISKVPHRAHLIRAAFRAHRQREYDLSIPVLLTQTDGICEDVINQSPFRTRDNRPCTAIYVDTIVADTFQAALLSPLARKLPINISKGQRAPGSSALNRHAVLHGEALDYGNRTNSLKAISLINYVAHVLVSEADS
jgi:hypothetical protein